jgi:hypothetical protein
MADKAKKARRDGMVKLWSLLQEAADSNSPGHFADEITAET